MIEGIPKENAGLHHRFYFDLIGSDIRIKNFYRVTDIVAIGAEAWEQTLLEGDCDYVYLLSKDSELEVDAFGALFTGEIMEKTLYQVNEENSRARLVPLETVQLEW